MGFLRTLLGYAGDAWRFLTGIPGDVGGALARLWKFIASVHSLVDHLISTVVRDVLRAALNWVFWELQLVIDLIAALARVAGWVLTHFVNPLRSQVVTWLIAEHAAMLAAVAALRSRTVTWLIALRADMLRAIAALRSQVVTWLIAEHAAMLAAVAALHAAIEREAADGYNTGRRARAGVATRLLEEVAVRNPVLRAATGRLITVVVDLAAVDNPLARIAAGVLIRQLVNRLGVDRVIGDLAAVILSPFTGHAQPKGLADVVRDVDERLTALEDQAARFQVHGGPEVEQAGDQWKGLVGPAADVALLGFFALAVADPAQWARAVANTAGAAVNDTIGAAAVLIRRG